jgi:uncharacterized protein
MEISGSHKIKASQQQVFQALLNPAILKESVPGCSEAEFVDDVPWSTGRHIKLVISLSIPGLSGSYNVFVKPENVIEPSHLELVSSPSSSVGTINARCVVDLINEGDTTAVNYVTEATMEGKVAATPEFVIKTAVKSTLDRFFKNLEKQL